MKRKKTERSNEKTSKQSLLGGGFKKKKVFLEQMTDNWTDLVAFDFMLES